MNFTRNYISSDIQLVIPIYYLAFRVRQTENRNSSRSNIFSRAIPFGYAKSIPAKESIRKIVAAINIHGAPNENLRRFANLRLTTGHQDPRKLEPLIVPGV